MKKFIILLLMLMISGCFGGSDKKAIPDSQDNDVKENGDSVDGRTQTLRCVFEATENEYSNFIDYSVKFVNNKPKEANMEFTMEFLSMTPEQVSDSYPFFTETYEKLNERSGITASTSIDGKKIIGTMSMDFDEMDDSDLPDDFSDDFDREMTLAEVKEVLEESGFQCN